MGMTREGPCEHMGTERNLGVFRSLNAVENLPPPGRTTGKDMLLGTEQSKQSVQINCKSGWTYPPLGPDAA